MEHIGQISITKFVITSGQKKGLWTTILAYVGVFEDEAPIGQHGPSHFLVVNPKGEVLPWEAAPHGSEYDRAKKYLGTVNRNCSTKMVEELSYMDNFSKLKQFLKTA